MAVVPTDIKMNMHIKGFIVLIGGAQAAIITGLKKKSE